MKYFDIKGGDVVVHPDALAIPCFNTIWTGHKDKAIAMNYIRYIVLNNHPKSPYVTSMPLDARKKKLANDIFGSTELPKDLIDAETEYREFQKTLPLQMLSGIRRNLEIMTESLNNKVSEDLSYKDMKELLDMASRANNAIVAIKSLEEQVEKEEVGKNKKVRGDNAIGYYEVPGRSAT